MKFTDNIKYRSMVSNHVMGAVWMLVVVSRWCVSVNALSLNRYDVEVMDESFCPNGQEPLDMSAPQCRVNQYDPEPCGWCKFSSNLATPPKWLASWCICGPGTSCTYYASDRQRNLHRYACKPSNSTETVHRDSVAVQTNEVNTASALTNDNLNRIQTNNVVIRRRRMAASKIAKRRIRSERSSHDLFFK